MSRLTEHLAQVYRYTTQGSGVLVTKRQQFSQLLHRLGRSEGVDQLLAAYLTSYVSCIHMVPDVHGTFSALTAYGVHTGIATNGPPDVVEAVIQDGGVRQFVHCIITPAHVASVGCIWNPSSRWCCGEGSIRASNWGCGTFQP
jgi:FMN phosphatase YigB (HAD superfamily)